MAAQTTAMLFALTSPHPSLSLPDFNKWYDERHAPSRAVCPGVHSVCRFHLVDDAQTSRRQGDWTWVAIYELESEETLQTEQYKQARKNDGDDESTMFDFLSRRVYRLLEDSRRDDYAAFASSGRSRLMAVVGLQPDGVSESSIMETLETYRREHMTNKSGDEGWLRSSFWQLSAAADPRTGEEQTDASKLLVLHEWEDTSAGRENNALGKALSSGEGVDVQLQENALLKLWKQF